ncbi:hypothetical protein [Streptomyces sp. NPDC020917]|uniref:hypothetical protein n=1 Tax=Streptomyces sp. NPDC020917 TaxID=3365102 RepID=UPI0037B2E2F6
MELPPRPAWQKLEATLPSSVGWDTVLVRAGDAAVWVGNLLAYPNGFAFTVRAVRRLGSSRPIAGELDAPMDPFHGARRRSGPGGLRFGLEYADGRRAATGGGIAGVVAARRDPDERTLRLTEHGGGGSDRTWDTDFFASPLPPEGPVTFVAVWPDAGAPESRAELDGALIRQAAARAVELWPEDEFLADGPSAAYRTLRAGFDDEPPPAAS